MDSKRWIGRKVVIIGAGAVGSTFAYSLAQSGLADNIAVMDLNNDLAEGQVLDLAHGLPYFPAVKIHTGTVEDYADAQVIVMTAGAKQRPGESRLELLQRNAAIIESVVDDIVAQNSEAVLLLVSNPVDVLTYVAHKRSGWPQGRVFGSGTVLDSARFRYLLGKTCGIDVHNVHAYILGEHGDSEFAAWSMTHVGGIPFEEYCIKSGLDIDWESKKEEIIHEVRNSAYHIIGYKGATHFAVGLAMVRIVRSILRNESSVLTVSAVLDGEYGYNDVCIGVPSIVTGKGIEKVLDVELASDEKAAFANSADILKKAIDSLDK